MSISEHTQSQSAAWADVGSHVGAESEQGTRATSLVLGITLTVLLVYEGVLLFNFVASNIAPYFPRAYDQAVYLTDSYRIYENMRTLGLREGLVQSFPRLPPAGMLIEPLAAVTYVVLGPGRLSALLINIIAFQVLLGVGAYVLHRTYGPASAAVYLGVLLAVTTVANQAGGVGDFRFDFVAMCLWGVLLALTLYIPVSRKPLLVGGLAALTGGLLILSRTFTIVYVIPLYSILFFVTIMRRRRKTQGPIPTFNALAYAIPLACWSIAALVVAVANLQKLFDYYVQGHLVGAEKQIRAAEQGVISLADSVAFYPQSLVASQLGVVAVVLLGAILAYCVVRIAVDRSPRRVAMAAAQPLGVLIIASLVVYVTLTSDEAKSPVVADIFVPAVALAAATLVGVVDTASRQGSRSASSMATTLVAGAVLAVGTLAQLNLLISSPGPGSDLTNANEADRMLLTAGSYIQNNLGGTAAWTSDAHLDFKFSGAVSAYNYEQTGAFLDVRGTAVGQGSVDTTLSRDEILGVLAASDVLILPVNDVDAPTLYPIDIEIASMLPELRNWATTHMRPLGKFELYGRTVQLYVRNPTTQASESSRSNAA